MICQLKKFFNLVRIVQPSRDNNVFVCLFNVITEFLGCWFFLNVVQGTVIDNLRRNQDKQLHLHLLSENQRLWVEHCYLSLLSSPKQLPPPSRNMIRRFCMYIYGHHYFERIMWIIIIINLIVIGCDHWPAEPEFRTFQFTMEVIFIVLYSMEFIITLVALKLKLYFCNKWNILNIVILFAAILSFGKVWPLGATIFSTLRLLRVIRLLKFLTGLAALIRTLLATIINLVNVMFLMLLMYYVFAIIGMFYFGKLNVKASDSLNEYINFRTFLNSLLTVYVLSTGENWPGVMNDMTMQPPLCSYENDDCGQPWAPALILCLQFLISVTLLNTFIAIIVDTFQDKIRKHLILTELEECLEVFSEQWARLDRNETWWLSAFQVASIANQISPSVNGIETRPCAVDLLNQTLVYTNNIYYIDALTSLFHYWQPCDDLPEGWKKKLDKMKLKRRNATLFRTDDSIVLPFKYYWALVKMQRLFRLGYRRKRIHIILHEKNHEPNCDSLFSSNS
eukprot:NODE_745_length_2391_cov_31.774250_g636_i0.p1 GENE.NODE_745_length_2391_cov_31.774250_g636_i0~~NODE_745_length_2391_cov_31.774250_g636_i0.p1  ORF type:complete len:507 (-),score=37.20 NODE_745_length_2391_cov_31.774250_g636_i0:187-1707(-)